MTEASGESREGRWRIGLLGGLRAERGGRLVTHFQTQKTGALLAYLAYYLHRSHSREQLIELLWPEVEPDDGRNSLRQTLFLLRRQLEPSGETAGAVLLADRAAVRLNSETTTTDVAMFQAALQAARRAESTAEQTGYLARAVELCPGELLPGYFEDWILQERQWLGEQYFAALGELLVRLEGSGQFERALEFARQGVRVDPLREEAHLDLIRLLAAAGHRDAALGQYAELARLMEEQLGAAPSPEVQAFAAAVRSSVQSADRTRATFTSPPAAAVPVGNLPFRLTHFFGRKQEIARLRALLQTKGTRLVTLTGPGGSGKTRLALETVGRLRKGWPGGIWFVPLQDLTDPQLIPAAVLEALRVPRAAPVAPLEQLLTVLAGQPCLLVLDNFEHLVIGGASLVRRLLERAAPLTVLVTSRQRLGLPGEHQVPVPPLPVPALVDGPVKPGQSGLEPSTLNPQLSTNASVRLFVDRAQAVRPGFQVTAANAAAVAGVCARLEGLPLALELAAARIGVATPEQMLLWLEQRFEFLVSRDRQGDRRHQSLRAALDGSFQLLSPELQRFFVRLSIFRGGWSPEAAEAICEEPRARGYLEELQEGSLVITEAVSKEMRYRLLETVREYGAEQLADEERTALAGRHLAYYLALAEEAGLEHTALTQGAGLEQLQREHDNLCAALDWAVKTEDAPAGLRFGPSLAEFWRVRSRNSEGRQRLAAILSMSGASVPTTARARTVMGAGVLAHEQGDFAAAQALYQESLAIHQELGNSHEVTGCYEALAVMARHQGEYGKARSLYERTLAVARETGKEKDIAASLYGIGYTAYLEGDLATAQSLLEEGLERLRFLGESRYHIAWICVHLGEVADARGDSAAAHAHLDASLVIWHELGDPFGIASSLHKIGRVAQHQGQWPAARAYFLDSLAIWKEHENRAGIAECLEGLAAAASGQEQPERAARLCGAAAALRETLNIPLLPVERADLDRVVSDVRIRLGEEAFAAAWARGQIMPVESAIALASGER